jgi:hypothetical protein
MTNNGRINLFLDDERFLRIRADHGMLSGAQKKLLTMCQITVSLI